MAETFDEAELLERVDNDIGFLAETAQMLAEDGPSLVSQIRSAIEAGDSASVGRHAHALKGMISNFCSPSTQACAMELEKMGKSGDLSAAAQALETLSSRVEALSAELASFIRARV